MSTASPSERERKDSLRRSIKRRRRKSLPPSERRERIARSQKIMRSQGKIGTKPEGWDDVLRLATPADGKRLHFARHIWRRYGLTPYDWALLWEAQGGSCPICGRSLTEGKLNIDHEHNQKKWGKANPAAVRGLLHWQCNQMYVAKHTIATAEATAAYLRAFEQRS